MTMSDLILNGLDIWLLSETGYWAWFDLA